MALAAAIIPQVVQFSDRGTTGAKSAENAALQVAIDNLMVAEGKTSVTANTTSVNGWTSTGTFYTNSPALNPTHFPETATTYYYCWGSTGKISAQYASSSAGTC